LSLRETVNHVLVPQNTAPTAWWKLCGAFVFPHKIERLAGLAPEKTIKKSPTTFVIGIVLLWLFFKTLENSNRKGVTILQQPIDQ
jgi:hypothetical protein